MDAPGVAGTLWCTARSLAAAGLGSCKDSQHLTATEFHRINQKMLYPLGETSEGVQKDIHTPKLSDWSSPKNRRSINRLEMPKYHHVLRCKAQLPELRVLSLDDIGWSPWHVTGIVGPMVGPWHSKHSKRCCAIRLGCSDLGPDSAKRCYKNENMWKLHRCWSTFR